EMTPEQIRCYSAIVSQSTWLFTDTIANNLRLAFPDATEEQMWNALEKAHVAKDVRNMPDGLDTWLGEGGRLVSGGQAQRIAIARALLSGRKILLLDEPTSQVDIESEKYIIQALEEFDETWTIICVTHRSSLLCVVDEVWRMDSGILERVEKEDIQLLTEEDNDGKN
ncbi:MAG: ATP-binding cassette domain-containing protein, partial [Actinomycetaceae bacterium]|nr:ATP-binding cassette domain-containing protein [Actinomycetaceae bacterium]